MRGPMDAVCPVCGAKGMTTFFEAPGLPVHIGILWPDRDSAIRCPKGDVRLAHCSGCGFVTNLSFDPAQMKYSRAYDNSLLFSSLYREYARSSAMRLVERYDLRNKTVVEIGCGKGDFLALVCELGNNRGVGFDPSFDPDRFEGGAGGRVAFVQDFYSERYSGIEADLVVCRYVFEHIPDPASFLRDIRRAIGRRRGTVVHFEVPNLSFILRNLSAWDIMYEHCSYFGRLSLSRVFEGCGFSVRIIEETFDGQYLQIEAAPGGTPGGKGLPGAPEVRETAKETADFGTGVREKIAQWRDRLEGLRRAGRRTAIWGAGAKGVGFLNLLDAKDAVAYAVDVNPYKRAMHVPGTGHRIVAPGDLRDDPPDAVIVMNPIYLEEIRGQVERLGIESEFLAA